MRNVDVDVRMGGDEDGETGKEEGERELETGTGMGGGKS
jgi:hypothetical protein